MRLTPLILCPLILLASLLAGCGDPSASTGTGTTSAPSPAASADLPEGCILPTAETVENGTYTPLSRPLFICINKKLLEKPHFKAFASYYLTDGQEFVEEISKLKTKPAELETSLAAIGGPYSGEGELEGTIQIDGSSSVFPYTQAVAEEFQGLHPKVKITVGLSGTGGGFKKFVKGEIDINDASRPISESEIAACKENGVEYEQLTVATDAITIVVSKDNDFCQCLSVEELHKMWEPDSKVKSWKDVNEKFPAEEMLLYGADTDSGTFDYFTEVINGKAKASRSDYNPAADDNLLVNGVAGSKFALGYIPYSYYIENTDKLRAVAVKAK